MSRMIRKLTGACRHLLDFVKVFVQNGKEAKGDTGVLIREVKG
ncbi:hypothetical protein [Sphaerisporangium rubeum]|uniref:Uncharacterized protein n=1 Tax=Sphaerisporangium rubeum TaxID=321317 RepID=A0A7X0IC38_9ACTN|nr:hypothetical protein [Sphaerisporangium rubeum]MBB6472411.1 hypothetical protein [Sphaerisporangium rubeum]